MANALTVKQRRFVAAYEGPGTGIVAARAAGYRGGDNDLSSRAAKLLQIPKVRAAVEARGVELPDLPGTEPEPPDFDTELGDEDFDGTDPLTFFRRIAGDTNINLDRRMKAMERVEQIEKRSAPDTDAEARFAAQRTEAQRAIAARLERRQTAEGLAAELNQIRCTVRDADLRAVLSKAVASLVSKRDGSPRQRAKRSSGGSAKEPKEPREAA